MTRNAKLLAIAKKALYGISRGLQYHDCPAKKIADRALADMADFKEATRPAALGAGKDK